MTIETTEITLPSYWASALINGDDSGMEPHEILAMDAYLERVLDGGWYVVSYIEDSERFTNRYDLYQGDSSIRGGTVMDYVIHR